MKLTVPTSIATISAILLSSCATSLNVKPVKPGPQSGLVYALPMTQFKIDITRQVASCDNKDMKVKTTFKTEKTSIEDAENIYVIEPETLSHFFNTASSSIEFHEGTRQIKSFNSDVTDAAAPALGSLIKSAISIATLGAGQIKRLKRRPHN